VDDEDTLEAIVQQLSIRLTIEHHLGEDEYGTIEIL
jgi:hypothetical protein